MCKSEKPLSEFGKLGSGLSYECKQCKKTFGQKYRAEHAEELKIKKHEHYLKNKDRIKEKSAAWYCENKVRATETNKLYVKNNKDWRSAYHRSWYVENKEKRLKQAKIYRENNSSKVRESVRLWGLLNRDRKRDSGHLYYKKNSKRINSVILNWRARNKEKVRAYSQRRRARERGADGDFTADDIKRIFNLQQGKCACCKSVLRNLSYHIDHIIPLLLGGSNFPSNLQILCQPCNQSKWAKHPIEFMQQRGFLL